MPAHVPPAPHWHTHGVQEHARLHGGSVQACYRPQSSCTACIAARMVRLALGLLTAPPPLRQAMLPPSLTTLCRYTHFFPVAKDTFLLSPLSSSLSLSLSLRVLFFFFLFSESSAGLLVVCISLSISLPRSFLFVPAQCSNVV